MEGNTDMEIKKTAKKSKNYADEDVSKLLALYAEHGTAGIEAVAQEIGKTVRSVRSKLVNLGAYVPAEKPEKAKKQGPSKKDLLSELSAITGSSHNGLDPASKAAISELIEIVKTAQKG